MINIGKEWDGIRDVEYLRDKLFAALKVPKQFMGYENKEKEDDI